MMDQSQVDALKKQREEIEAIEAQVDEAVPVVQALWHKYITGDTPLPFTVALWLAKGDLHDIRRAILEVGVKHADDEQSEDFDDLLYEVDERISPGA